MEDSKRRKLEDDLARARTRLNSVLDTNPETEEFRSRLKAMQARLESVQTRFSDNLDLLLEYRAQLDQLVRPRPGGGSGTGRKPRHEFGRLNDSEKCELSLFERDMDRLVKGIPSKRSRIDSQVQEILRSREMFQLALEVLGLNSIPDLFSEVESLERENNEMAEIIADKERSRGTLAAEVCALEAQYSEISAEPELPEDVQRDLLETLSLEVTELQRGLSQIMAQKVKDEREFSQIYGELEEIFRTLECSWERVPGEGRLVTADNVLPVFSILEETLEMWINEQKAEGT
jgi:hypothetical protein